MANEIILVFLIFENVCQHHNMRLQSLLEKGFLPGQVLFSENN